MHAVGVIIVLLCSEANQVVMGVTVFLLDEMGIIGGNNFDVMLACQTDEFGLNFHLPFIGLSIGIGLVGLVTHKLNVVVVTEAFLEP